MNKEEFYNYIVKEISLADENDPCMHCFRPGNGCDDCRDCDDAKISHQLYAHIKKLKDEYKEKFNGDFDEEEKLKEFEMRFAYWKEEIEKTNAKCEGCDGDFHNGCLNCKVLEEKLSNNSSLEYCKKEYRDKYNKEYVMNIDDTKDSFIISAEEAKKMVEQEKEKDNSCLRPIMEKIKEAIKKKDNHCYISVQQDYVINKLRNLGYTVSDIIRGDRPYDSDCIKISW